MSTVWWGKNKRWDLIGEGFVFETWRRFFKFKVYKEDQKEGNMLYASYPHGLFPMALPLLSGVCKQHEILNEIPSAAIATKLFYTPIMAPLCRWLGCVPATYDNIEKILNENGGAEGSPMTHTTGLVIMPDGVIGTYYSHMDREVIYVKHRKGFIKSALKTGASIVPVYNFGHTQLYTVYPSEPGNSLSVKLSRRIGFAVVTFLGPYWLLPFIPHRTEIVMVIGEPICVEKKENPTHDDINALQKVYIDRLHQLFENYKSKHPDYVNKKLEIV
jgi:diacylglycerol O-acyltransferase 2, plant